MLREFFCSGPPRRLAFAWCGLLIFIAHALFKAWLKWALNRWYTDFYDVLGDAHAEIGSGDDLECLAEKRAEVAGLLGR